MHANKACILPAATPSNHDDLLVRQDVLVVFCWAFFDLSSGAFSSCHQ